MFRKILVAVDESQQATWAADLAARLAVENQSQIALLHVVDAPLGYVPDFGFTEIRVISEMRSGAEEILASAAARIPTAIPCRRIVREGTAPGEIIKFAEEWGADLLVLGTHGRGRIAHLLLGSCTEAVLRHAPCPVLTVRQKIAEPAETAQEMEI